MTALYMPSVEIFGLPLQRRFAGHAARHPAAVPVRTAFSGHAGYLRHVAGNAGELFGKRDACKRFAVNAEGIRFALRKRRRGKHERLEGLRRHGGQDGFPGAVEQGDFGTRRL